MPRSIWRQPLVGALSVGAEQDPEDLWTVPISARVWGPSLGVPCGQQDKSSGPRCPGCQPSAAAAARSGSWHWPSARGLHARLGLAVPKAWGRQRQEEG